MAYEKQNFIPGQKLKASQLNHIEDGIVNAVSVTEQTLSEAQKSQARKNLALDDIADGNGIEEITIESVGETKPNPSENVYQLNFKLDDGSVQSVQFTAPQGPRGIQGPAGVPGYTPVKGVDYYTDAEKAEWEAYIAAELAKRGQLKPEFANSVEECTDTTKLYVLPDGYIYASQYFEETVTKIPYTNLAGNVRENYRQNTSGVAVECAGAVLTDFIPVKKGQIVRIKGFNPRSSPTSYPLCCFYTGASESAVVSDPKWGRGDGMFDPDGDVYYRQMFILQTGSEHPLADSITHIRINGTKTGDISDIIVTVDEEIGEPTTETVSGYKWQNTGHAFVPADYEDRILELEENVEELKSNASNTFAQKWAGKKWLAMGDSLTSAKNADGTDANTTKYYHTYIAEETGINVVIDGRGGTGYKRYDDVGAAFYQRTPAVPTDADVITIFGSGNDLSSTWDTYGLGEVTDTGTNTLCGCMNTAFDNLFAAYPAANVGVITPAPWDCYYPFATEADGKPYRMTQYVEKLIEICKMRSIPVLDLYHCSGLRPWDANFVATMMDDGCHPNENGHKLIAPKIKAFLESLIG